MLKGELQDGRGHPTKGARSGGTMEKGMKFLCPVKSVEG